MDLYNYDDTYGDDDDGGEGGGDDTHPGDETGGGRFSRTSRRGGNSRREPGGGGVRRRPALPEVVADLPVARAVGRAARAVERSARQLVGDCGRALRSQQGVLKQRLRQASDEASAEARRGVQLRHKAERELRARLESQQRDHDQALSQQRQDLGNREVRLRAELERALRDLESTRRAFEDHRAASSSEIRQLTVELAQHEERAKASQVSGDKAGRREEDLAARLAETEERLRQSRESVKTEVEYEVCVHNDRGTHAERETEKERKREKQGGGGGGG